MTILIKTVIITIRQVPSITFINETQNSQYFDLQNLSTLCNLKHDISYLEIAQL